MNSPHQAYLAHIHDAIDAIREYTQAGQLRSLRHRRRSRELFLLFPPDQSQQQLAARRTVPE